MLQQLLDDLRGYFEAKSSLTTQEQELWDRLKKADYPILGLQDDDLAQRDSTFAVLRTSRCGSLPSK